MAHKHSVYDTDTHFKIDPITRAIENTTGKVTIIQNDHNSERFTFEIPKVVDGHDMSLCNSVQVHYNNINATDRTQNAGVYEVEDLQISPDSNDVVICSWLISGNATKYVGSLNFVVRFACVADDGTIEYAWNTAIYSGIAVSNGIYNGEAVVEQYADILEQWKADLEEAASIVVPDEQVAAAVEAYMAENPVEPGDVSQEELEALATVVDIKLNQSVDVVKTASRIEATDDTTILDYYVDVTSEDETQAELIADFVSQKMQYGNRIVNDTTPTRISTSLKYPNLPAGLTITAKEGYLIRVYNGGSSKCTWTTAFTLTEVIPSAIVIVQKEDGTEMTMAETDLYTVDTYSISYVDGSTKTVEVKKLSNEKAVFYGKILSILGDSISTYGGDNYTTDSDGMKYADGTYTYLGNRVRYPQNNLNVLDVNKTYWKMLIDELDLVLGINESWAGTRVSWDGTTEGRDVGALKHIACTTRIKHLGENGNPAYILVNAGTNDIVGGVEVGTFDYTNPMSLTETEIEALPVDTFANAYRTMLIRLQYYYPDSQIIVLLPNYSSSYYTPDEADKYNEIIKEACDYFGVLWIDARTCGVTMFNHDKYLPDTIHYNADGMVLLKRLLKNKLNSIIKGEPLN